MLFTIIRDFFVQHVFGGTLSDNTRVNVGNLGNAWGGTSGFGLTGVNFQVPINGYYVGGGQQVLSINICDWLSTTATIITLVIILVCIAFFIRWIFKVVSNSILLR